MALERIRLDKLTKIYHRTPVVENLSLSVQAGEFCVILGPSGSGKSTVMNMIGGFTPPTSGEIFVDGRPTTGLAPHARDLGMMFQGYALFPHLTVQENVAFPLRARGVGNHEVRTRVAELLEMVELQDLGQRLPGELSGGQQQRTALARALVFGPKLLLMDEPLAALDRRLRERMQTEIRAIQRKLAITVLYITHDQQEAMMLADVLVVMNKGLVEQTGPPLDVYHRPRTRFVCEFLGDSNILDVTVESIEAGTARCRTQSGGSVAIDAVAPMAVGETVALAVRPENLRFSTEASSERNRLSGRVSDILDLGSSRRYSIEAPGSTRPLQVTEQGRQGASACKPGDTVILTFDSANAVVVAGRDSSR